MSGYPQLTCARILRWLPWPTMTVRPAVATEDVEIAAPPEVPGSPPSGMLVRLLPMVMSVATLGVMAAALLSGAPAHAARCFWPSR